MRSRRRVVLLTGLPLVATLVALAGCSSGAGPAGLGHSRLAADASTATDSGTAAPSHAPRPLTGSLQPISTGGTIEQVRAAPCTLFPADNIWHAKVTSLPVDAHSAAYVASIGATSRVHPDFGSGTYDGAPFGIPVTTVPAGQAKVHVTFDYASESDPGPYPIPANAKVEGGSKATGDRHVIIYDPTACRAYELWSAYPTSSGAWKAGSGAIFNLRSDALRPAGWTSADAAGLPIIAGLVQYGEVASGQIDHAIRMTVPSTRDAYVWPARHEASSSASTSLPPMGERFRLKASVDISGLPAEARVVAQALKTYGAIVADNGSSWYLSGTQDSRWDNDALHALSALPGSDFEAVDSSSLMVSPNSGATR